MLEIKITIVLVFMHQTLFKSLLEVIHFYYGGGERGLRQVSKPLEAKAQKTKNSVVVPKFRRSEDQKL